MALRLVLLPLSALVVSTYLALRPPQPKPVGPMPSVYVSRVPFTDRGGLREFMDALAARESNGNDTVVNRFGYMGKYQFGVHTLYDLGRPFRVSRREFLWNPELQDSALTTYLQQNQGVLQPLIDKYDGRWYHGVYITESGILAGAHLVGPQGVKSFFNPRFYMYRNGTWVHPRTRDGNGTHVEEYIKRFSGYKMDQLKY